MHILTHLREAIFTNNYLLEAKTTTQPIRFLNNVRKKTNISQNL